ncbi:aminotransferase class III-fold pyridoxal phosphate-dependent enzyme [Kribbella sp. NBC_01505]|uniref:aspartate aminotransferase family protein n=1 Tax=Kribbella sp. NBC_01505 TaxID=2903580 RepID=UPI00386A72DD
MTALTAFSRVRRHLPPYLALTGKLAGRGAVEQAARASRVELSDGRFALDFGSYAVTLLGHRPPAVVEAVRRQLDTMPTSTRSLVSPATAAAAAAVVEYLGGRLSRVYFGLGGADAVEAVIKLAWLASGRRRIVAVEGAFHGKSLGALSLTHNQRFRAGLVDVLAPVVHVAAGDPDAVAREVAKGDVAALVFEPVQGENGVQELDPDVLRTWCAAAAEHGTFVVADEIQCGLRRCGDRSVALAAGLPVDAVLLGKPLGGGVVPLSAAVCNERLYAPLVADPMVHTATFSGHPLACAALPAALESIELLAGRGRTIARVFGAGLAQIHTARPDLVRAVRGRGLLWGLELPSPHITGRLIVGLAQAGLIVSPCMSRSTTLRLLPPLVADDSDLSEALQILAAVVGTFTTTGGS